MAHRQCGCADFMSKIWRRSFDSSRSPIPDRASTVVHEHDRPFTLQHTTLTNKHLKLKHETTGQASGASLGKLWMATGVRTQYRQSLLRVRDQCRISSLISVCPNQIQNNRNIYPIHNVILPFSPQAPAYYLAREQIKNGIPLF